MARHKRKPRNRKKKRTGKKKKFTSTLITGKLRSSSKGFGFVETPQGDYYVRRRDMAGALHGDTVEVRPFKAGPKGPEGAIQKVVERAFTTVVGVYHEDGMLRAVVPLDRRIHHDFFLDPSDPSPQKVNVNDGDTVLARILVYPSKRESGMATIEKLVGKPDDVALPIETIIANHGLATEFSDAVLEEAKGLSIDVESALLNPLRRDLRDRNAITIDPADAKDFDDAISCTPREKGGWVLGVHIADVSHYVRWDSHIDIAARQRGTSVYLVDRVLPMLPEKLSNDLCSLRPNEDRLAMTVDIEINSSGRVVQSEVYTSVIRSKARLSYEEALDILEERQEQPSGLDFDLKEMLVNLDAIATIRNERRMARGGIDFDTVEARVVLDEEGKPTGVDIRRKTRATSLIEEAMLAANESVARLLDMHGYRSAFRTHPDPSPDTLLSLLPILQEFGYADEKTVEGLSVGSPYAIQSIIERAEGKPEEYLLSNLLLRSMKRAEYTPEDDGHYGLGADAYLHFTSPIRRYPDLIVHRTVKALLANNKNKHGYSRMEPLLEGLTKHASIMEREADSAAAESQKVKLAEYMANFVGQKFTGVVSGIDTYGMFVRLDETTAEGLLPVKNLTDDFYEFDHEYRMLVGVNSHKRYRMGQRITVVLEAVDVQSGLIDFTLP